MSMFYLLSFFWFIRTAKSILFWIWLWQLKEYHWGRFIDHFRTEKGKKLLFNELVVLKIILAVIFSAGIFLFSFRELTTLPSFFSAFILFLLLLYFFESVKALRDFSRNKLKIPVLTGKTSFILSLGISFELLILSFLLNLQDYLNPFWAVLFLLGVDILAPIFCSVLVLIFQPLSAALKDQILRKAKEKRERFKDLLVIGITGSYGKTSVKEFLATVLAEKYNVLKTKEHQNSEVGISQCILNELGTKEYEIFVCEMGAYNRGGIKLLCDIAKPKIGILTGINEQHMATFGSQKNIAETKYELIESLPQDGLAILNYDDPIIKKTEIEYCNPRLKNIKFYSMTESEESKLSSSPIELPKEVKVRKRVKPSFDFAVAQEKQADFWASDIKIEKESISFKLFSKDGDQAIFDLNLAGAHHIRNILAVACCAKNLGMTLEEIAVACKKIESWQSGMQIKKGIYGFNIIDATYSANPTGVMSHLDYLKVWPGKKAIVMPCLIELGSSSENVHKRIGKKIGEVCDLAIITSKDRFKEIEEAASAETAADQRKPEILFMEDPKEIFKKIRDFCHEGDVILLESRVPKEVIELLSG